MALLNRLALVTVLLTAAGVPPTGAHQPRLSEPEAKANFLYYLALFATWPQDVEHDAPLVICVLGATPVTQALRPYESRVVAGRRLELRDLPSADDILSCHLLFLPQTDARRLSLGLAAVAGAPVLTVGESDTFLQAGGMLRLTVASARLRFHVELQPADRVGITFSSRLLAQAARVTRGGHVVRP